MQEIVEDWMNRDEQSDSLLTQESHDLLKTLREKIHTIESHQQTRHEGFQCELFCTILFAHSDSERQCQTILT